MRLFTGGFQIPALKIRMALEELEQDYELEEQGGPPATLYDIPSLKALKGQLPLLEDGEAVISQAPAILVHLGQSHGRSLWFAGASPEVKALEWLFLDARLAVTARVMESWPPLQPLGPAQAGCRKTRSRDLETVEATLVKSRFIAGNDFSLVDCALAVSLAWLGAGGLLGGLASSRYVNRIRCRKSWQALNADGILKSVPGMAPPDSRRSLGQLR